MADTTTTVELLLRARDLATGPIDKLGSSLDRLHDHLSRIRDIALGNILGNLGIDGIDAAVRGVEDLGKGMVDTNAQIELMRQRLNILYQSTAEGAQAFAFLKQNELTKPFDIQDIMDASVQLVAFKQNITTVLPALEDVAGAMGQTLPTAAQAFTDAMAGRFQMMKRDLGISKEELVAFGLQMNAAGHITDPNSFVSAFLALANSSQFKGGADKMAQTWTGLMSSMSSQWTYFKANLGQGAFDVLEKQLSGIVHTLQNPGNSAAIQNIETQIGAGLAKMTVEALNFGRAIGPYVGSAVALVARAWPLVEQGASAAFAAVGTVVSAFGNWLQNTGYPAIEKVITAIANAWVLIAPTVAQVLQTLGNDFSAFAVAVSDEAGPLMTGLAGAFQIGMGAAELAFGGGLTLMSGDWAGFQNDFNAGVNSIIVGAADLVAAFEEGWGRNLGQALLGPWTQLARGVRDIVVGIGTLLADMVAGIIAGMNAATNLIANSLNAIIIKYNDVAGAIPGFGGHLTVPKVSTVDPMANVMSSYNSILGWFQKNAPGINQSQSITAGVSNAQYAADMEQARRKVIADMTGQAPGGPVQGQVYATSSGPGKDILDQVKALFKNLGRSFTMKDLLAALGLTDIGKGKLAYTGPSGGLPVLGPGASADAVSSVAAGLASPTLAKTGRVPLGNLGADFMAALVSTSGLRQGTDPATRAAQEQADGQKTQIAQTTKQTQLMQQTNELLTDVGHTLDDIRGFFNRLSMPGPVPINPLQVHGVGKAG